MLRSLSLTGRRLPLRVPFLLYALCCALFAVSALLFLHQEWPSFGPGTYQYEGKEIHSITTPPYVASESSSVTVSLQLQLAPLSPHRFVVTPDDCLESLTVNGHLVPLPPSGVCLDAHGTPFDLSPFLHTGSNELILRVHDNGGFGGVSVAPALDDPFVLAVSAMAFASLVLAILFCLLAIGATRTTFLLSGILLLGLLLRLALAPARGYDFDVGTNQGWAKSATVLGMTQSLTEQTDGTMLPNYPPFSMMIFSATGHLYQSLLSPSFDRFAPVFRIVIKLPAILADLLTALLLFAILRRSRGMRSGLFAALAYVLHPAVFYDSAVWGQTDALYTLFIVAALWVAAKKQWMLTGCFSALAVLTKVQAVILFPTVLLFLLRGRKQALQIVTGGIVTFLVVLAPFLVNGNGKNIADIYLHTVGTYSSLTFGAYNLWQGLLGSSAGQPDTTLLFPFVTLRTVGLLLFGALTVFMLLLRGKDIARPNRSKPLPELPMLLTALTAYAFFLFTTEMHERYLFPLMALALPLLFVSWQGAVLYCLSSLLFLLNLLGVLPWTAIDRALFSLFPNLPSFIGTAQVFTYVGMFLVVLRLSKASHPRSLLPRWRALLARF